ncbi:MAG: ABC transporter substrate-binding protein [Clostridia bacterium]|nr:ABC transporter substrate-binding protein [Clostridia bacterium]
MKKRALSLVFASIAAFSIMASGCGGEDGSSISIIDGDNQTQTTALTVFGHKTDRYSISVFEDVLQSFMSQNSDITVSYESAPETSYWQALDRRNSSGNLDDVFMLDRDRLIGMTEKLADLSDVVNENAFSDFARSQLFGADGAVFAIPASVSTYGLYVNYDLLQKHGKETPKNYNEFKDVCSYFVSQKITPIVCNNYSTLPSLILARGMYETYCTKDTASELKNFNAAPATLAEPLNDGIDFVYEMIDGGWIDVKTAASTTHLSGDLRLFATGKYPFMITGGWAASSLNAMLEDSLRYGIHPFPILERESASEEGCVLVAQTDSLICVKKGENENEAKKLAAMLSSPEALFKLSEKQSCFTPLKEQTSLGGADSAITPSAYDYFHGKYVIASDVNLNIPLDNYLTECGKMILSGKKADDVKGQLLSLLEGVGK